MKYRYYRTIDLKTEEKQIIQELGKKIIRFPIDPKTQYDGYVFTSAINQPDCIPVGGDHYQIRLPINSENNPLKAAYELSHEQVHLICPGPIADINYFEEGLAVNFQLDYTSRLKGCMQYRDYELKNKSLFYDDCKQILSGYPKYDTAINLISELEDQSGYSVYSIARNLLQKKSIQSFSELTPPILSHETGVTDSELLKKLCAKFY